MIGWAIAIIVLVFFVPITAYAESIEELSKQGIIESTKSIGHEKKMTDIFNTCTEHVLARDLSVIPACVAIAKAYNEAMSNLFSQHRDLVEGILYE